MLKMCSFMVKSPSLTETIISQSYSMLISLKSVNTVMLKKNAIYVLDILQVCITSEVCAFRLQ